MATELAAAYLTLVPTLRNAQATITRQIAGIDVGAASEAIGTNISTGIASSLNLSTIADKLKDVGSDISNVGSRLTRGITVPAAAAATAVASIALAGGWKRLTAIEDATAAIKSMGYEAQAASDIIKVDVYNAVRGTAFSMAEAGSAAAGALSAQVAPGEELTAWIRRAADAATRANTDFNSMAQMLLKVEGAGKLSGDVINQMAENGLYVMPMLQKHFGLAGDAISEMVSKGEISSALFKLILDDNIAGAALSSGDTTRGALANMTTAFTNMGAKVLDSSFPKIRDTFKELQAAFESERVSAIATQLGNRLDTVFTRTVDAIRSAVIWFAGLSAPMQNVVLSMAGIAVAAGPALFTVGKITSGVGGLVNTSKLLIGTGKDVGDFFGRFRDGFGSVAAASSSFSGLAGTLGGTLKSALMGVGTAFTTLGKAMFTNPIGIVITSIAALVGLLTVFFTQTETGKTAWASFMTFMQNALAQVGPIFESVMGAVMPVLEQVGSAIMTGLGAAAQAIMPILIELGGVFQSAFSDAMTTLLPVLQESAATLGPVFMDLFTVLGQLGATLASTLLPVFGELIAVVAPLIAQLVGELLPVVAELAVVIVGLAGQILTALVPVFSMVVQVVGELLAALLPVVAELVSALVPVILTVVGVVAQLIAAIMPLIATILSILIPIITQIIAAIVPIITLLVGLLIPVIQALLPIITTVFTAVAAIISSVMTIIQGIIMTVTALISGNWAGVWDGIKMVFSGIWDLIVGIVMGAINIVLSVITGTIAVIKSVWESVWGAIGGFLTGLWARIVGGITAFVGQVQFKIDQAMAFIGSIPARIADFFAGIGEWLVESGKSLIQGFLDGITAGFEGAKGFVEDGLSSIRDLFPFSPAKEGPFSGRGWVAYSGLSVGETFGQSVASALNSEKSGVVSALGGIQSEFDSFDGSATASLGVDRFGDVAFARNAQRASYDFAAGESEFSSRGSGAQVNQYISGDGLPASAVAEVSAQKVAQLFR